MPNAAIRGECIIQNGDCIFYNWRTRSLTRQGLKYRPQRVDPCHVATGHDTKPSSGKGPRWSNIQPLQCPSFGKRKMILNFYQQILTAL